MFSLEDLDKNLFSHYNSIKGHNKVSAKILAIRNVEPDIIEVDGIEVGWIIEVDGPDKTICGIFMLPASELLTSSFFLSTQNLDPVFLKNSL